ncbi:MAG: pyruvate kinase [Myxococcales bacterium]|nr:pyruvate kinase [Myxococcales bacterium]MBK7192999.1 pyruvate kinase [Myxococcales bacterium]
MTSLRVLRDELDALERAVVAAGAAHDPLLTQVDPQYRDSARNFVDYVGLRQHDLRPLQRELWAHGLSSLGRLEGHVRDAIGQVRARLDDALAHEGAAVSDGDGDGDGLTWVEAQARLHANTQALLGPQPPDRHVYVMVTAPSAAEVDAAWVERLLAAGMNVLRINAAHEDEAAWRHIATLARAVAAALRVPLRIAVDLPGPKLRTVMLTEGVRVVRWKPARDELGRIAAPCEITVRPGPIASVAGRTLFVPSAWWARIQPGVTLEFRDARGKRRALRVTRRDGVEAIAELRETAYVVPQTRVTVRRRRERLARFTIVRVPPRPARLALALDDELALVAVGTPPPPGLPAIGCEVPAALARLEVGQRVLFDDGHLETLVVGLGPGFARLRVTHAPIGGLRLGGEKSINLPDTELDLPLLAEDDERALAFAAQHADLVDASFVRDPDDVRALYARLAALGADRLGVVLKIETTGAFACLPAIILAALERAPVGVMIARGDLAIESGYQRLAELQEEILWLCEAAHVPVIWATQVLDQLARTGRPSRAEVTDAAMAVRAECVMLNKGPYVAEAVAALDDILRRMEQHQYKKRSLYRRLHLALP